MIADMSTQSDSFCIQTSSVLARKDLFAFKDSMIYLISVTMCPPQPVLWLVGWLIDYQTLKKQKRGHSIPAGEVRVAPPA